MRSFEERKAEIFRRSEQRLRLRKRRRRQLLGIGVPLACVVVCLTVLLPGRMEQEAADGASPQQWELAVDEAPVERLEPDNGMVSEESAYEGAEEYDCVPYEDEASASEERKQAQSGQTVVNRYGYANMSLVIPEGWEYEITQYSADIGGFGIVFYPVGERVGSLSLMYYDAWGVCGTGLEEQVKTVGGYEAWVGTYDGAPYWDFISLRYLPGNYVFLNRGADLWYGKYEEQIDSILASAVVAGGVMSYTEAEETALSWAEEQKTGVYQIVRSSFDAEEGIWEILLGAINNTGPDHMIHISPDGSVNEVVIPQP